MDKGFLSHLQTARTDLIEEKCFQEVNPLFVMDALNLYTQKLNLVSNPIAALIPTVSNNLLWKLISNFYTKHIQAKFEQSYTAKFIIDELHTAASVLDIHQSNLVACWKHWIDLKQIEPSQKEELFTKIQAQSFSTLLQAIAVNMGILKLKAA